MSEILRKSVGKAIVIHRPSMSALILRLNKAERARRSTPNVEYDEWHIPGGSTEPEDGGSKQRAAIRETFEETGQNINVIGSLGSAAWNAFFEGSPADFSAEFFLCLLEDEKSEVPEIMLSNESSEAAWVSVEELDRYEQRGLTPEAKKFILLGFERINE
ncbi:TPA: NUDIX hydrolase [Candidatus Saccharibacteria bacterium]|nr:NUDIX hydrolase [Candidatus Saccharibacteria bacterium]HIO87742.1 NUDIX hydrolase [Candidatus Saccharibacteria bacterium]